MYLFPLSSPYSFANEINTVDEAKTYYPAFGLVANVALIFSGQYVKIVSMIRASLAPGVDAWGYSLKLLMAAIVVGGGAILGESDVCEFVAVCGTKSESVGEM